MSIHKKLEELSDKEFEALSDEEIEALWNEELDNLWDEEAETLDDEDLHYNVDVPDDIIEDVSKKSFMRDFKYKLCEVFNIIYSKLGMTDMVYIEGTHGWQEAFDYACTRNNLPHVADFVDSLSWYEYDLFCDIFSNILLERKEIIDNMYLLYEDNEL